VDGQPLIWRGKFTNLDIEALTAHALELMRKADHLLLNADFWKRKGGAPEIRTFPSNFGSL
jgi:hypothetical protein